MSILLSFLSTHLLNMAEQELINNEPEIVVLVEKEMQLLISKLEQLISSRELVISKIVNPVLDKTEQLVTTGINAGASAVMNQVSNESS